MLKDYARLLGMPVNPKNKKEALMTSIAGNFFKSPSTVIPEAPKDGVCMRVCVSSNFFPQHRRRTGAMHHDRPMLLIRKTL